jgi:hypothetical protein
MNEGPGLPGVAGVVSQPTRLIMVYHDNEGTGVFIHGFKTVQTKFTGNF